MSDQKFIKQSSDLVNDIRQLIELSRSNVAIKVNAELTILYWNIGNNGKIYQKRNT